MIVVTRQEKIPGSTRWRATVYYEPVQDGIWSRYPNDHQDFDTHAEALEFCLEQARRLDGLTTKEFTQEELNKLRKANNE